MNILSDSIEESNPFAGHSNNDRRREVRSNNPFGSDTDEPDDGQVRAFTSLTHFGSNIQNIFA